MTRSFHYCLDKTAEHALVLVRGTLADMPELLAAPRIDPAVAVDNTALPEADQDSVCDPPPCPMKRLEMWGCFLGWGEW